MATNNFEMEICSDDVDIKHEPLEPDVEDYVSIPVGRQRIYLRYGISFSLSKSQGFFVKT